MVQKTIAGKNVEVNDEGYMTTPSEWNREIGTALAGELGITMTDKHWEVVDYLRNSFNEGVALSLRNTGHYRGAIVSLYGVHNYRNRHLHRGQLECSCGMACNSGVSYRYRFRCWRR